MLLRRLIKAGPWVPWIPLAVLVALICWMMIQVPPSFDRRQLYFRAGLLVAALGLCFIYDDPATETTDPSPSPLRKRRALRTLLGGVVWAVLVTVILSVAAIDMDPAFILSENGENLLPVGRLVLEAATMAAWGLAIASMIAKRWDNEPGKFASAALLALYAASWAIPHDWKPWVNPANPRWDGLLPWWWLAFGIGILVAVVFGWDSRVGRPSMLPKRSRPEPLARSMVDST